MDPPVSYQNLSIDKAVPKHAYNHLHAGSRRRESKREMFQHNPSYESCSPKKSPPDQGIGNAVLPNVPRTGRELPRANSYTTANISSSRERVYEEII